MSSSNASSESGPLRPTEIECEYSFIFLDVIYPLILISELCRLFEDHLKLSKSKETSEEAKNVAKDILRHTKALIVLGTKKEQKNALNAFKGFLSHRNQAMVLKAFDYIDQGRFDALVSGSAYHVDINLLIYQYLVVDFVFFSSTSTYDKNESGDQSTRAIHICNEEDK